MPKPIINGSLLPQRKSIKIKFDPNNGTTTTQEFECAGDGMSGLANQFGETGASYDLTLNPVRSTLVATSTKNIFAPNEEVQERWELYANQTQLDIKEHPNWAGLSTDVKIAVLKDADRHQAGKAAVGNWGATYNPGDLSTADHFYQLLIRGSTHYLKPQFVLRVTCNVSNTYQNFVEADGGVGSLYTTAELGTPVGRLQSTVQAISEPPASDYVIWRWLKVSYTEVVIGRNRVEVSNELWLAQWPTILYS